MVKKQPAYAGDTGLSHSWVGKIPWRRKWHPTPVFLPGKSHGQRSLVDYGHRVRHDSATESSSTATG